LPPATANNGHTYLVWDATTATDCTVGGGSGSYVHFCVSNGSIWEVLPGSGGGGGGGNYYTETITCTSTCTLAHTPTTFINLSRNGLVQISGTDFTRSGTTINLTDAAVGGDVFYAQYYY